MHTPPFHRRVFLWVFIIMFAAVAPAAVFYTAGYRWNPKKGAIERNGTLIIDTTPEGAKITLNGAVLGKASPITQQDVAPGTYRIRLEIQGYHPWEKTLEVRPERVTFVNEILLWPIADPQSIDTVSANAISVSPNGRYAAYVRNRDGSFGVSIVDTTNNKRTEFGFSTSTFVGNGTLRWNSNSSAVIAVDGAGHSWIVNRTGGNAIALPEGAYRWSGTNLIGVISGERYAYDVSSGVTSRSAPAKGVIDTEGSYEIILPASSTDLALKDRSDPNRLYGLPQGAWTFATAPNGSVVLSSAGSLFVFSNGADPSSGKMVPSDGALEDVKTSDGDLLLSVHENEIWLMATNAEPELLTRKSVPIINAVWHRLGRDVFYATPTDVVALDLDTRDGRMETTLGSFDEIFGLSIGAKDLYVSARKGDARGVWTIRIE